MTKDLVFYTHPRSRSAIVHWMLEEVGAPYRIELKDFGTTMKAADYLALNRMGKVPAIRHGDTVVTEAAAICAYLADAFPEAGLAPAPQDRGDYYRWLFFAAGCVEPAMSNHAVGWDPAAEMQGRFGYGSYAAVVDTLAEAVAGRRYIAGESVHRRRRLCRLDDRLGHDDRRASTGARSSRPTGTASRTGPRTRAPPPDRGPGRAGSLGRRLSAAAATPVASPPARRAQEG